MGPVAPPAATDMAWGAVPSRSIEAVFTGTEAVMATVTVVPSRASMLPSLATVLSGHLV